MCVCARAQLSLNTLRLITEVMVVLRFLFCQALFGADKMARKMESGEKMRIMHIRTNNSLWLCIAERSVEIANTLGKNVRETKILVANRSSQFVRDNKPNDLFRVHIS